jgi:hypothetical protein
VRFALINAMKFAISVLALAAARLAQDSLTIDNKQKERVSTPEVEKIYFSACSVVREEFDVKTPILPRVKLVLGTSKTVSCGMSEKYGLPDGTLFVRAGRCHVGLCRYHDGDRRMVMTKRAMNWADATVEIERLAK